MRWMEGPSCGLPWALSCQNQMADGCLVGGLELARAGQSGGDLASSSSYAVVEKTVLSCFH